MHAGPRGHDQAAPSRRTWADTGTKVKKGAWLLAMHVLDGEVWRQVKAGEITGLSIGGSARRNPE